MLIPGDAGLAPMAATTADRFSSLYERDYPRVFAFAYRRTGDRTGQGSAITARQFVFDTRSAQVARSLPRPHHWPL